MKGSPFGRKQAGLCIPLAFSGANRNMRSGGFKIIFLGPSGPKAKGYLLRNDLLERNQPDIIFMLQVICYDHEVDRIIIFLQYVAHLSNKKGPN
jgi:hypothetical protein